MKISAPLRHVLMATALTALPMGGAAFAETPADTLVIANTIDDMISLDPAQSYTFSSNDVDQNVYDRLVDFDPADLGKGFQPSLAESWDVSEDGKALTLTLREGVQFHSGNPVRPEDAAWSLQRAVKLDKTPAFILTQFGFTPENVEDKITFDDRTVTLHLDKPYAPSFVLNCLTAIVGSVLDKKLVLEHEVDGDLGNAWLATNSAGSGAFRLKAWRPNQMIQLVANPDYFQGAPEMERVVVTHVEEPSAQRLQLERGDIDVARNLTPSDIEAISDREGVKVVTQPKGRILYMGLNQNDPLLSNPAVIEALKHLVDYQGIADSFLKGQFVVHQSFLPKGYLGELDENPWDFNVEKAREILQKAGIKGGKVKAVVRDLREYIDVAQTLQAAMAEVGLTLEIEQMTGAQMWDAYRARQVPLFIGEWGPDYPDPNTNAATFAYNPDNSDAAGATGNLAWRNGYAVPEEMGEITVAATLEQDADKRAGMYRDLQRQYQAEAPLIPLFERVAQDGVAEDVEGWTTGGTIASAMYRKVSKGE